MTRKLNLAVIPVPISQLTSFAWYWNGVMRQNRNRYAYRVDARWWTSGVIGEFEDVITVATNLTQAEAMDLVDEGNELIRAARLVEGR